MEEINTEVNKTNTFLSHIRSVNALFHIFNLPIGIVDLDAVEVAFLPSVMVLVP